MHNPEFIVENEMDKLLWDFEMQTGHLISARRPDLLIANKPPQTCRIMDFDVPANYRVKMKESEKSISTETLLENWKKTM